jgi:hypothetical protein
LVTPPELSPEMLFEIQEPFEKFAEPAPPVCR